MAPRPLTSKAPSVLYKMRHAMARGASAALAWPRGAASGMGSAEPFINVSTMERRGTNIWRTTPGQ